MSSQNKHVGPVVPANNAMTFTSAYLSELSELMNHHSLPKTPLCTEGALGLTSKLLCPGTLKLYTFLFAIRIGFHGTGTLTKV